ncbi:MAG: FkbM family methyltransferase [Candidatus Sulfotelmatobacter sp.]
MNTKLQTKTLQLTVPYGPRRFSLTGSAADESVLGAIEKANGAWEPGVMSTIAHLVKPGDVCLDIGANIGVHALVMSDLVGEGHVYAFEPSSTNQSHLLQNIRDNAATNITPLNFGLSNLTESRTFHYLPRFPGCSFATREATGKGVQHMIERAWGIPLVSETETVQFTTLDEWVASNNIRRLDFIKMDVEGFERFVIEGGRTTLRKFGPRLITEFNKKSLTFYSSVSPESYYQALTRIYPYIYEIPEAGELRRVDSFSSLRRLLEAPRFWADLLCSRLAIDDTYVAPFSETLLHRMGRVFRRLR